MIGELITGAANLLGGWLGADAAKKAGDQAAQIQRETNAMQINLANTAHQREMADLKAAGLNPLLSGTGGQGASTPTLQAPTQSSTGSAKAGAMMGNALATLPTQIMQYISGQQQIELQRATAEKINAETNNVIETGKWITPRSSMAVQEGTQRIAESTQRTLESKARTASVQALQIPQVHHLMQQIAESAQRTKTEEQRTAEQTQIARNAEKLYKSKAEEAAIIAAQMATYYKEYFLKTENQKIDQRDLEIELLRNKNTQQLIANILENEYGRMSRWTENFSTLTKSGAVVGAPKNKVIISNPYYKK